MKKLNLLVLLFIVGISLSHAKEVPSSTAQTVGYNYLTQHGAPLGSVSDLHLVYTSGTPAHFYVFSGDHSFVMVSADDAVTPVLAYSKERAFNGTKIAPHILSFLSNYDAQIGYAQSVSAAGTAATAAQWHQLVNNLAPNTAAKTTTVSPLLSTTWDQAPYYNDMCPYDASAGELTVTGCVATATAQVMKYWNWPATGVGMHSYSTSSYGTLSANFGGTTYNWAGMPGSISAANDAIATLMYHVGVAVEMEYGTEATGGSGAYVTAAMSPVTNCAEYALKTYFNYDATTTHGIVRADYATASAWISAIKAELDASRPVIYAGDGTAGGHCFVADGYDASSYLHINWGWSGSGPDGYYSVDALNPPDLGTGGGAGGFNSDQQAIIGLKPAGAVVSTGMALASLFSASATTISYGQSFSLTTSLHNGGTSAFSGTYAALVFNSGGTLIDSVQVLTGSLAAGGTSGTLTFATTGMYSMVPGTYNIAVYYKPTGSSWALAGPGSYVNSVTMTVVNNGPIELYNMPMTPSPATFVQGSAASVSLQIGNMTSSAFDDSVDVSLFTLSGTGACGIQAMAGVSVPAMMYGSVLTFSTSNITAAPGTYLLAAQYKNAGSWYLLGDGDYQNPILINVVAPALAPDIYEVNNTAATAYTLPLTFVSNVATKSTTGSNFHIGTDQDYYKIVLPAGYNYSISARVNDANGTDDATTYTVDANWSYSTNGGTTWSGPYDNTMTGNINLTGYTGGTVIFHVSHSLAGSIGTYILKLSSVTRTPSVGVASVTEGSVKVYPNPATQVIYADLGNTSATHIQATLLDVAGRKVATAEAGNDRIISIPVAGLDNGMYLLQIATDAGNITKKITVSSK